MTETGPFHLATQACAGSFTFRNLGREVELEVALTKGGLPVQLKLAASWSEHLTDIPYGIGISAFSQPEFFHARVLTELRCASGVWQLAGLFTPPPDKKAGAGSAPLPADRVLLFVRATAPGLKPDGKSGPDNERATHSVLAEWIEADAGLIAGLLEAAPDLTSAAGLRAALEDPVAAGTAMLMETAFVSVPSRAVAKIISVRSFPFPAEVDPAQPPQTLTVTNRTPAGAAVPGGGVQAPLMTPSFFNAYAHRESGTVMEVHCAPHGDGALTELELKADISALAGGDVFGHGVAEVPQPRFQNLHCSTVFTILPGVPALAGLLDPLLPAGQSQPAVRPRKILFFVTVLP